MKAANYRRLVQA